MSYVILATTNGDTLIDRVPPDVTDVVSKAIARLATQTERDPEDTDIDAIIETELDAIATVLRRELMRT